MIQTRSECFTHKKNQCYIWQQSETKSVFSIIEEILNCNTAKSNVGILNIDHILRSTTQFFPTRKGASFQLFTHTIIMNVYLRKIKPVSLLLRLPLQAQSRQNHSQIGNEHGALFHSIQINSTYFPDSSNTPTLRRNSTKLELNMKNANLQEPLQEAL